MAGESKESPLTVFKRLFTPFAGSDGKATNAGGAGLQGAYESVTKVTALMSERRRLRGLEAAEIDKLDGLSARLRELDSERIHVLTDYRVSGKEDDNERAQALLKQCSEIGQEIDDARAVAGGINARILDLEEQLKALSGEYRRDLGMFLTAIYGGLIDEYNQAAPAVAEVVLKLAAMRRVMNKYLAGNSNGWSGEVLLPGMRAGDGNYIAPLLNGGSREFDTEATQRMDAIVEQMRAAGFVSKLD